MNKYVITSDSTCDLTEELLKKYDIKIIPLTITLGDKQYKDNVDVTSEEVLKFVDDTGIMSKTSAISVFEYTEFFKKITDEGYGILHFDISSEDSACYNNACLAAKEFENVYVVDTRKLSTGQGILAVKASIFRSEGLSLEDNFKKIEEIKNKSQISFVLDRLDYLHKGGRCSLTTLLAAKILKIHPYIAMSNGSLKVKKKYSGNMIRACEQYVQDLAQEYCSYDKKLVFITHCMATDQIVSAVRKKVEELFDFEEIVETTAGTTVSCHCGKNTIGVIFIEE